MTTWLPIPGAAHLRPGLVVRRALVRDIRLERPRIGVVGPRALWRNNLEPYVVFEDGIHGAIVVDELEMQPEEKDQILEMLRTGSATLVPDARDAWLMAADAIADGVHLPGWKPKRERS